MIPAVAFWLAAQDSSLVFRGRANQLNVQVPRIEATATIDGVLDEAVWGRAAHLTDFSQYQPVDGRPAEEPTEVLVWYAPDAIFFGIRAREVHGDVVRATRANRDNISSEDQVQILLDTYNDRQVAFVFGVNPLGVQQDGTRSDNFGGGAGGFSASGGGFGSINPLDGNVDLNPDYTFESKGRLVPGGYEVEIRIPFKSLRYKDGAAQTWGINVLRRVQHSGFQDSWTPAVRATARFLTQVGTLAGMHDLKRGLVLEVTPTATGRLDGAPETPAGWNYQSQGELSGDVRWGIRQNLTLNGTYNPDFSQVEADVGQVLLNERFALFYPEKRPFFLDGLELFDSPNQLIYTRRIVAPQGGVKLAGKLGGANIGAMVVADDQGQSLTLKDTPVFGIARLRKDIGGGSALGAVLTDREVGGDYSRLGGMDLRIYHSKLYFIELQGVQSWSAQGATHTNGPLFQAAWDRTGRSWGFHYSARAISPDFQAAAGFVNRVGIIDGNVFNRVSFYGKPGALVQTYGAFMGVSRIWSYSDPGAGPIEGGESMFPSATLRGGWLVSGSIARNFYSYDPAAYTGDSVDVQGVHQPFVIPPKENNQWTGSVSLTTPTFRHFTATARIAAGHTPIFREAAPGKSLSISSTVDVRPTAALRATFQIARLTLDRVRDGSRATTETIPRLKVEYQLTRAIFFRFVGQYSARERSAAVDRNGHPILVDGILDQGETSNEFRMDWLFSYRPVPGTLLYLGYGSTLDEPDPFRFSGLHRSADGFFGKISYLIRM